MKKWVLLVVGFGMTTLFLSQTAAAQSDNLWKTLAKVTYKKEYNELLGYKIDVPVFEKSIKQLEGKEVTVRGYIIPTDGYKSHTEFVFSAFPYNMCFFCGQAGPETVMEITAKSPVKYSTDPVTLRGILKLNDKDVNRLMFSLSNAVLVE